MVSNTQRRSRALCRSANPRLLAWAWGPFLFLSVAALGQAPPGSVYVPLDSWVYSAFDRLAGLGAINKQFAGLRPWTRIQCAKLVLDADENLLESESKNSEALALYDALNREFSADIKSLGEGSVRQVGVESFYTRATVISGTPLRDGYHFGQTLANDFGRPFNTGFNNVSGFSGQAVRGRFFAYLRAELQHSPAYAGLTTAQQSSLAKHDGVPSEPYSQAAGAINHFELLDSYVGLRLGVLDVTFGRQSLWWGPGTLGAMLASNNIDPVLMVKVDQVEPFVLPGFLQYLGPMRVQAFVGRLAGEHFPPRPYLHGEKILFKPTPNLEIGFSRTAEAFGQGIPFTFGNFFSTYFSVADPCCGANPRNFPGRREFGLDFSYRLPHLRKWVTIYSDNFSPNDFRPPDQIHYWSNLVNPSRVMFNPGVYVSQLPRLRKFDFRFELANTRHHEEAYTSFFYKDAYMNKGFLIGDMVGRRGSAFDASTTYWFSARKRLRLGWREHKVSKDLIPSGGFENSWRVEADQLVRNDLELSLFAQYEHWGFPFLATGTRSDSAIFLQLTMYLKQLWSRVALGDSD